MGKEGGDRWRGKVAEQSVDEEDEEVNIYLFSFFTNHILSDANTYTDADVRSKSICCFFFFYFPLVKCLHNVSVLFIQQLRR